MSPKTRGVNSDLKINPKDNLNVSRKQLYTWVKLIYTGLIHKEPNFRSVFSEGRTGDKHVVYVYKSSSEYSTADVPPNKLMRSLQPLG